MNQTLNKKEKTTFTIPSFIKNDINEKWFYMYQYISSDEVKTSIQRDFLKIIDKFWVILSLLIIIPAAFLVLIENIFVFHFIFFTIIFLNLLFIPYLLFLGIKRSNILRNNAYITITTTHISIDWQIIKIGEKIPEKLLKSITKTENIFEEKLFQESHITKSKDNLFQNVIEQIKKWYKKIFSILSWRSSRNSLQLILVLTVIYTVYNIVLFFIYIIQIFVIYIFWIVLNYISKKILIKAGHEIIIINDLFEKIDKNSKELIIEKESLSKKLKEALDNDWKDALLLKINNLLEKINKNAINSTNSNIKLKECIKDSKYKEMFEFNIYNSWIKKQLITPLTEIKDLLQKNLDKLILNKENIEKQIINTMDESLKWPLKLTKQRSIMRIEELKNNIASIQEYINKLQP